MRDEDTFEQCVQDDWKEKAEGISMMIQKHGNVDIVREVLSKTMAVALMTRPNQCRTLSSRQQRMRRASRSWKEYETRHMKQACRCVASKPEVSVDALQISGDHITEPVRITKRVGQSVGEHSRNTSEPGEGEEVKQAAFTWRGNMGVVRSQKGRSKQDPGRCLRERPEAMQGQWQKVNPLQRDSGASQK